jgi:hypothetical protein
MREDEIKKEFENHKSTGIGDAIMYTMDPSYKIPKKEDANE